VNEPKTIYGKAPVPVIAPLAKRLEKHWEVQGAPQAHLIFVSRRKDAKIWKQYAPQLG
jgi:hypothetical protein